MNVTASDRQAMQEATVCSLCKEEFQGEQVSGGSHMSDIYRLNVSILKDCLQRFIMQKYLALA